MVKDLSTRARTARTELRARQNAARGFNGLHGAKRVARGDYLGGYEHVVMTTDGALLCGTCIRDEWWNVAHSTRHGFNDGWRVAGVTHSGAFDESSPCAHCGRELSAYVDDDE